MVAWFSKAVRGLARPLAFAALILIGVTSQARAEDANLVTIGVGGIQSSIPGADPISFGTMLETQILKTNKFTVIERNRLQEILKEKGFSAAGITEGTGKISGISGVGYLIYGSITKLGAEKQGFSTGGVAGGLLGGATRGLSNNFGTSSSKYVMDVDLRIVDASNGQIRYADTVEEVANGSSATSIGGVSVGQQKADPLADVQRAAAKSITALITTTIYPIKVIAAQGDGSFVVNYGDSVLTVGDQLKIFQMGESFKDPDTGQILGAEEKQVGLLTVTEVNPKFSKTALVSGAAGVGNVARKLSAAERANSTPPSQGKKLP